MTYFKSLLFNFLCVFFVNHVIPGVEIDYYSKIPEIKGDLVFSFCLGFICSLVFPALKYLKLKPSHFKIGFITFIISFGAYGVVNILPVGVRITTPTAFIWSGLIVWFGAYLTNHLEFSKYLNDLEFKKLKEEKKEEDK